MSDMQEYLRREADALSECSYGIGYLDDALTIRPCDLIVIAAKTGMGKTQLGTQIALHNAQKGKRVYFIALEAEELEIERRLKYKLFAQKFFENRHKYSNLIRLTWDGWMRCKYPELIELEHEVARELPAMLDNLEIYQPGITEFTKRDFELVYEEIAPKCDLIILDHIHYLAPDDRENDFDHIKKTMWKLRDLINKHRVPVIALSHLRKEDKFNKSLLPTLEELHGSSEISKQANTVISFGEAWSVPSRNDADNMIKTSPGSTFCKILKARLGAERCQRYVSLLKFNFDSRVYEEKYAAYLCDRFTTELEAIEEKDFEFWMQRAREPYL